MAGRENHVLKTGVYVYVYQEVGLIITLRAAHDFDWYYMH